MLVSLTNIWFLMDLDCFYENAMDSTAAYRLSSGKAEKPKQPPKRRRKVKNRIDRLDLRNYSDSPGTGLNRNGPFLFSPAMSNKNRIHPVLGLSSPNAQFIKHMLKHQAQIELDSAIMRRLLQIKSRLAWLSPRGHSAHPTPDLQFARVAQHREVFFRGFRGRLSSPASVDRLLDDAFAERLVSFVSTRIFGLQMTHEVLRVLAWLVRFVNSSRASPSQAECGQVKLAESLQTINALWQKTVFSAVNASTLKGFLRMSVSGLLRRLLVYAVQLVNVFRPSKVRLLARFLTRMLRMLRKRCSRLRTRFVSQSQTVTDVVSFWSKQLLRVVKLANSKIISSKTGIQVAFCEWNLVPGRVDFDKIFGESRIKRSPTFGSGKGSDK